MAVTFLCLYCGYMHDISKSTLEHAIPQSLGGAHAPDRFKIRNVCATCNNNLGAFVDASFAKSWTVTNGLVTAAHKLYDGTNEIPLPLMCMGPIELPGISMPEGYLSESWIGPSGETMIWLRRRDDSLYWYVGGNPRHRGEPSTVYWFPTSDDPTRLRVGLQSLFAAFKNRKRARKVMGIACDGLPGSGLLQGFNAPDAIDVANIAAIRSQFERFHVKAHWNLRFDDRFICKLALGVGYGLFGDAFASTDNAYELRKGCWPKNQGRIRVRGVSTLGVSNPILDRCASYPGAVALVVALIDDGYVLMTSIDGAKPSIVWLAHASLSSPVVDSSDGYALLLFPSIREYVETTFVGLVGHRSGAFQDPALSSMDARLASAEAFWAELTPLPAPP